MLLELFTKAGINASVPENIQIAIWQKFLFITTISALGGLIRVPIGMLRENPYIMEIMYKTAKEIYSLAHAKKIDLPDETIEKVFVAIEEKAYETTTSTQRDIMSGNPSELENFNGYVVQEGKRLQIKNAYQ